MRSAPQRQTQVSKRKFMIPGGQEVKYGNIYSIVAAVEVLEDEFSNDRVSVEDRDRLMAELVGQFKPTLEVLRLNKEKVAEFCEAANLSCGYAMGVLFEEPKRTVMSEVEKGRQAALLGGAFVELDDLCWTKVGRVSEFACRLTRIQEMQSTIGVFDIRPELGVKTRAWLDKFGALDPTSLAAPELTDRLASEIGPWRQMAEDVIKGDL